MRVIAATLNVATRKNTIMAVGHGEGKKLSNCSPKIGSEEDESDDIESTPP